MSQHPPASVVVGSGFVGEGVVSPAEVGVVLVGVVGVGDEDGFGVRVSVCPQPTHIATAGASTGSSGAM